MHLVIEAIPFSSFKEKLRIIKRIEGKGKVIVYKNYVYYERLENDREFI